MARASLLAPFFCAMPWRKKYLENETPEQREERLAYLREYDKQYAAKMTPEQREARLAAKREAERRRFARMTPEQRELQINGIGSGVRGRSRNGTMPNRGSS